MINTLSVELKATTKKCQYDREYLAERWSGITDSRGSLRYTSRGAACGSGCDLGKRVKELRCCKLSSARKIYRQTLCYS